jgi:hypothetical protein
MPESTLVLMEGRGDLKEKSKYDGSRRSLAVPTGVVKS